MTGSLIAVSSTEKHNNDTKEFDGRQPAERVFSYSVVTVGAFLFSLILIATNYGGVILSAPVILSLVIGALDLTVDKVTGYTLTEWADSAIAAQQHLVHARDTFINATKPLLDVLPYGSAGSNFIWCCVLLGVLGS